MKIRLPWRKEDWAHYEFTRDRWPEGITSWTYKRLYHPFMWAVFGNDRDGCTPWVHGKQWTWFKWWLRNRCENFTYCILGLAKWEDGVVGDAAWEDTSHLERKFWKGSMEELQSNPRCFVISGVRDKTRKMRWRPFIRFPLLFGLAFWWGWKPTTGHLCMSLKKAS